MCTKIIPYTSSPRFTGKVVDAFWNVMDLEGYNVYIWRCVGWEPEHGISLSGGGSPQLYSSYHDSLPTWTRHPYKEEVTTTWPRQEHGRPNEFKLHT